MDHIDRSLRDLSKDVIKMNLRTFIYLLTIATLLSVGVGFVLKASANDYQEFEGHYAQAVVCCDSSFTGNVTSVTNDTIKIDNVTINIYSISYMRDIHEN